ncbi:MAG: hypothetical protein ACK41C_07575 [Phenylobacterium sp.]|uniref:hypothetical protein n=1 Tax=Phenylobacterium sp. TaxID=1871053 RepID=UPI00391A92F1
MLIASLLASAAVTAAPARIVPPDLCPRPTAFHARLLRPEDRRGDAGAQTLQSLPPAHMELAVHREVAGCTVPVVVRENVQGDGRFSRGRE